MRLSPSALGLLRLCTVVSSMPPPQERAKARRPPPVRLTLGIESKSKLSLGQGLQTKIMRETIFSELSSPSIPEERRPAFPRNREEIKKRKGGVKMRGRYFSATFILFLGLASGQQYRG